VDELDAVGVTVRTETADGVLTLWLNRPARRNAVHPGVIEEICAVLDEVDADDDVRALVLTGAGGSFCVGADPSDGGSTFGPDSAAARRRHDPRDWGGVLALRLFACTKPVVAAVNGDAVGLGATMLLPMDRRLAAPAARFGFVFTRRGIAPEACSSWFLPRVVGIGTALRWTMSGALIGVEEALREGLVHRVIEPEALLSAAQDEARALGAVGAPVSVAVTRQMMWRGLTMAHPMEAHRMESAVVRALGASPDAREGVLSFLERREPQYTGRPSADLDPFRRWWSDPPFSPSQTGGEQA
jgi:enoyl-CoA hydratase/carnithine racemase